MWKAGPGVATALSVKQEGLKSSLPDGCRLRAAPSYLIYVIHSNSELFQKMNAFSVSPFAFLLALASTRACDTCAIYTASQAEGESTTGFFTGAAYQFTDFDHVRVSGREIHDPSGQYLHSSIEQWMAGYNITPALSVQLNVPYIYRSYRRPEGFSIDKGSAEGFGDASVAANYLLLREDRTDFTFTWNLTGGLKLPTGDTHRIREEFGEMETPGAPASGIHGHDLALGSGSFDGLLSTSAYFRYQRFFATASLQYDLRNQGADHYRYANEFSWDGGIGAYLLLRHEYTLALEATVSAMDKSTDTFMGENADDTGMHILYAGPKLIATWKNRLSAEAAVEVPVSIHNSALQSVPDLRVRTGVTWRF